MYTLSKTNLLFLNNNIISNANWITAALANLELQMVLNYSATAKKYKMVCIMLIRQYTEKTISNYKAIIEY